MPRDNDCVSLHSLVFTVPEATSLLLFCSISIVFVYVVNFVFMLNKAELSVVVKCLGLSRMDKIYNRKRTFPIVRLSV